jgi:hypothetical protein
MATAKITLICDSGTADGNLYTRGALRIVPSFTRLGDVADQVLIEQAPVRVFFPEEDGPPSVDLYPNDLIGPQNQDGTPAWAYTVYYDGCPGSPPQWSFWLLSTNSSEQRLSGMEEVQPLALADKNYTQPFSVTDTVAVPHNLGKYPAVTVMDSAGDQVDGDVVFTDLNNLTVSFSAPFSGTVTCN